MGLRFTMSGRWPALLLAAAVALAFADSSIVMLGLPEIYRDLDASISEVSLVITGYNPVVAVVALALVPVIGRVRPALLVGTGLVIFVASSLACGLVSDLTPLVALRAAQGLGAALVLSASLPVMAELTGSPARGPRVVGPRGHTRRRSRAGRRGRADRALRLARDLPRPGARGRARAGAGRLAPCGALAAEGRAGPRCGSGPISGWSSPSARSWGRCSSRC